MEWKCVIPGTLYCPLAGGTLTGYDFFHGTNQNITLWKKGFEVVRQTFSPAPMRGDRGGRERNILGLLKKGVDIFTGT
jgi:hypothetical protein